VRVLVVDDSAAIRARLAAMLRELPGVDVREASSADEALASHAADPADVVVLDVHMPGRSGLDVLPELKAHHAPPVVLVVTSHPTEHLRRQALATGADLFLDKSREFALVLELVAVRRR
jgi:DNA-binding NarL/FixJ family response regulator